MFSNIIKCQQNVNILALACNFFLHFLVFELAACMGCMDGRITYVWARPIHDYYDDHTTTLKLRSITMRSIWNGGVSEKALGQNCSNAPKKFNVNSGKTLTASIFTALHWCHIRARRMNLKEEKCQSTTVISTVTAAAVW